MSRHEPIAISREGGAAYRIVLPNALAELREFIASGDRHFRRSAAELTNASHIRQL